MMIQAFYTGLTGLKTNQFAIDVLSENLANTSTIGFRGNSTEFASMYEKKINTSSNPVVNSSVGVGVRVGTTVMDKTNGSLLLSDRSTDLAIDGDGWFGVQGDGKPLYTRDGTFSFDSNRNLVTQDGYHVLGTMANNISGGVLTNPLAETKLGDVSTQQNLSFPDALSYPPIATTKSSFFYNLGVDDKIREISSRVIDASGSNNDLNLKFTKSAVQGSTGSNWDVVATTRSLDGKTTYDTKTGTLSFDSAGALLSSSIDPIDNNGSAVVIDLGSGFTGITSSNLPVTSGSSQADGKQGGDLIGYDINKNAEVIATFSNGQQSSVGKVALFHFQNDKGLERINGSRFQVSANSGKPLFFKDANGKTILGANLKNYKLESSNVKYEVGLTELIVYQRAYDANSKSITTADQMIQKALNMNA
jgi:flagellar hook protein FlgE